MSPPEVIPLPSYKHFPVEEMRERAISFREELQRRRALQLAEEAHQLAMNSGLTELAKMIESRLPFIRSDM